MLSFQDAILRRSVFTWPLQYILTSRTLRKSLQTNSAATIPPYSRMIYIHLISASPSAEAGVEEHERERERRMIFIYGFMRMDNGY
jgi:hypothetical protein